MFELTFHLTQYPDGHIVGTLSMQGNLIKGIVAEATSEEEVISDLVDTLAVKLQYDLEKSLSLQSSAFHNLTYKNKSTSLSENKPKAGPFSNTKETVRTQSLSLALCN